MRLISEDALAIVTIFQEAEGESYQGKVAVGEVIRNRMRLKLMSDGTVSGTVLRAYQFSGWNTAAQNRVRSVRIDDDKNSIVKDCITAWAESKTSDLTKGATHYVNLKIASPTWAKVFTMTAKIGDHSFFVGA